MYLENILGLGKKLVMKFKESFLLLNMSFKSWLNIIYPVRKELKNIFGWMGMDRNIAHYKSDGKTDHKNEHNISKYHISDW